MQNETRYTQFHLTNPIPDENRIANVFTSLVREYKEFRVNVPVGCLTDKCSNKQQERVDLNMFCGSGGYLYLYLRMYDFVSTLKPEILQQCSGGLSDSEYPEFFSPETYIELATKQFEAMNQYLKQKKDQDISFLMSNAAVYMLGAYLYFLKKDKDNYQKCIGSVLNLFADIIASPKKYEQELLYGIPGYIYMFLWLHKKFAKEQQPYQLDLSSHIHNLCKLVVEGCGQGVMKCQFHKNQYLGAAHGILGVIQILLLSYSECKEYFHIKDEQGTLIMLGSIQQTLDQIIKLYYQSGNIPSSYQKLQNTKLVQFCHGMPGAIAPILQAYQIFNNQDYLNAAIHMCENIYQFGMIKKGYGICHGIPGNSYAFMQTFRITGNDKMEKYAYQFLQYKQNPHVYNDVKNFPFNDRFYIGISDNPMSLMLGTVGDMCAMMDFIDYKGMPGYEI